MQEDMKDKDVDEAENTENCIETQGEEETKTHGFIENTQDSDKHESNAHNSENITNEEVKVEAKDEITQPTKTIDPEGDISAKLDSDVTDKYEEGEETKKSISESTKGDGNCVNESMEEAGEEEEADKKDVGETSGLTKDDSPSKKKKKKKKKKSKKIDNCENFNIK